MVAVENVRRRKLLNRLNRLNNPNLLFNNNQDSKNKVESTDNPSSTNKDTITGSSNNDKSNNLSQNEIFNENIVTLPSPTEKIQEDLFIDNKKDGDDKLGQVIAGVVLIVATDIFIGIPLAAIVILGGVASPPAIAAEVLEIVVVLPINIFGVYLIYDATKE